MTNSATMACIKSTQTFYTNVVHMHIMPFIGKQFAHQILWEDTVTSTSGIDCIYISIESNCNSSTCSLECNNALTLSRFVLGCCIKSIFNNSMFEFFYSPEFFSYSLWSSCYVKPVTQECPPSSVTIPSIPRDPSCNFDDGNGAAFQLFYSTVCKRRYIESTISKISHVEGCSDYLHAQYDYILSCEANRFGKYCNSIPNNQFGYLYWTVSTRCRNSIICEDLCREILLNISNTVGCCFIDHYNTDGGSGTQEWLNSDFWSMCDVKYPGNCKLKYTDDDSLVATVISSVLVPTIIVIVATATVIACVLIIAKKRSAGKKSSSAIETVPQGIEYVQEQETAPGEHMYECIQDREEFELRENAAYATGRRSVSKW